jgi:hypothetical protein
VFCDEFKFKEIEDGVNVDTFDNAWGVQLDMISHAGEEHLTRMAEKGCTFLTWNSAGCDYGEGGSACYKGERASICTLQGEIMCVCDEKGMPERDALAEISRFLHLKRLAKKKMGIPKP